jgi:hypothetical protein
MAGKQDQSAEQYKLAIGTIKKQLPPQEQRFNPRGSEWLKTRVSKPAGETIKKSIATLPTPDPWRPPFALAPCNI